MGQFCLCRLFYLVHLLILVHVCNILLHVNEKQNECMDINCWVNWWHYRTFRTNTVHRWPYNVQLDFHFVHFCGYGIDNMLFGANGVIISPAGKRAPDVLWPAASLQPGERLGYRPQQGLRFLRVCWCNNDRSGVNVSHAFWYSVFQLSGMSAWYTTSGTKNGFDNCVDSGQFWRIHLVWNVMLCCWLGGYWHFLGS